MHTYIYIYLFFFQQLELFFFCKYINNCNTDENENHYHNIVQ